MLHSLPSLESCNYNGIDMTVLERQQARLKWVQQQQQEQNYVVQNNSNPVELCASSVPQFQALFASSLGSRQLVEQNRPEVYLGSDEFPKFVNFSVAGHGPDFVVAAPKAAADYSISRTSSCQMTAFQSAGMKEDGDNVILDKMESTTCGESLNKRKAEAKTKCSTEVSRNSSKENSKASEVQKPDYIHVRARRGQATDSHSLAERARREKISKKMKCLQDLVPGCNKITGKAGMLDEIINYVQSLQRQVEFLSMKLAALNPSVEFNFDNLPAKEFPAYVANFPAAAKLPAAMANLGCLQFNPLQKEAVSCTVDATMHPPQTTNEGIPSVPASIPEQAISSSCITILFLESNQAQDLERFPFPAKMATESSESEEEGKITGGNQHLIVEDDLREMGKKAAWSVSSCKSGNGVSSLRDDNLETYWQSDGAQPHLVNIQFQKKVKLQLVVLYVDFKLDESYTPSKISIRAGDGFHNLKEIKTVELVKPTGWVYLSLSGNDPRETFVNTFMLQIAVLSNHLNGRDTHVRQIKVYGPRPNPIPHQPFQFTSMEFITYSTVR
ncbi:hypothetical protein CCACVL1_26157 [Corchorus capsularis]|uniref:Anaphase-promoting complex subunit 10 n=1 Tax=Corchorus capsularis TaxID=210143 RepID=A0A1R3GFS9_COCAP|nr:hypothetical protein CCACVL1_26157 [Corchorus capsularis]